MISGPVAGASVVGALLLVFCAYQLLTEDGQLIEIVKIRASSFQRPFFGLQGSAVHEYPGFELARCVMHDAQHGPERMGSLIIGQVAGLCL